MDLPDFLNIADGEVRLTGHRVGLYHVICPYIEGHSVEMIAAQMPTLPLALIHKVVAFYLDNQQALDADIASSRARLDSLEADTRRTNPAPALAELRQRLAPVQNAGPRAS